MRQGPRLEGTELRERVALLPLEDKVRLASGAGAWTTHEAPRIGLRSLRLSDGPHGVRDDRDEGQRAARCTPCGSALSATWDPQLVQRVGALVGAEAAERGVNVLLGPTMNIQRSPLAGRNFECFSEDPILTGVLAAAWIQGVQGQGVAATAKHFICNDAETDRTTVDCVVDERALREIYLVPFEYAARAGVWAVMSAYNRVNGSYANRALVLDVLKREWRWDGLVMSDWWAAGDTVGWASAGLDLEMPGPGRVFGAALLEAVASGDVAEATLDDKVVRLLGLAARTGRLDGWTSMVTRRPRPAPATADDDVLAEAAAAGIVLLRNDGLLPLPPGGLDKLAVIGPRAGNPTYQGAGSAHVTMRDVPTPLEAIRARFAGATEVSHEPGCSPGRVRLELDQLDLRSRADREAQGVTIESFPSGAVEPAASELSATSTWVWRDGVPGIVPGATGRVRASTILTPAASGTYVLSLIASGECGLKVAGANIPLRPPEQHDMGAGMPFDVHESRGEVVLRAGEPVALEVEMDVAPRTVTVLTIGCYEPEPDSTDLLEPALRAASTADAAVLVVGTSAEVEREGADRETTALPIAQVQLGRRVVAANPATIVVVNAGAAVDLDWARGARAVLYAWYPGEAFGTALADVLSGAREPGGRLPMTIARRHEDHGVWSTAPDADARLEYRESIFVGYRHFDAQEIEPEFCFGHGLGYGTWAYEDMKLSANELRGGPITVQVTVRNVGARRSREVVQLYVGAPAASTPRPPRELKAFGPVTLEPGEAATVELTLDARAFAHWDGAWHVEPGTFDILAGRSSRDIRLSAQVVAAAALPVLADPR